MHLLALRIVNQSSYIGIRYVCLDNSLKFVICVILKFLLSKPGSQHTFLPLKFLCTISFNYTSNIDHPLIIIRSHTTHLSNLHEGFRPVRAEIAMNK